MSQAEQLLIEAQRCYRLARGIAGPDLSDELEAIGRAFEREAQLIETLSAHSEDAANRPAD